jgi:hypothetical protein
MPVIDIYQADVQVDWIEHLIHEGLGYIVSVYSTIGAGGTLRLSITTPAAAVSKGVEVNILTGCNKTGTVVMTEGDTVVIGGGSIPVAYSGNRNSVATLKSTFFKDGTMSATGTAIITEPVSAGASSTIRFILKPATTYTATLTTDTSTTIAVIRAIITEPK